MDHARMRELDEQFHDSYCEHCKRRCESQTVCESCGEPPKGEDIDMQYCRHCNEHATFIEACEFCGGEITKGDRVEAVVMPTEGLAGGQFEKVLIDLVISNYLLGAAESERNPSYNSEHFHHKAEMNFIQYMENHKPEVWNKIQEAIDELENNSQREA